MQTFNLDLSSKKIQPLLNAKQGDVGRKFRAVITDGSAGYQIPANAKFSVWYSGTGGDGNYTEIGDRSAFSTDGNTVTVELITQMLNLPGNGRLCLTMDAGDGTNISTWNIPYFVESVPGMGSKEATQYFNEQKNAAERAAASAQEAANSAAAAQKAAETLETDESLSLSGVAADAKVTGERITAAEQNVANLAQEVMANTEKIGATSIICDTVGEVAELKDASDLPLAGLKIFGKTTQDGTPTPDAPVDLVNAGEGGSVGVTITGGNMLNLCPNTAGYKNRGITFDAKDGGTHLYGTSTDGYAQNRADHYTPIHVPSGTYTLKMEVSGETDGARFCVRIVRDGVTAGSAIGTASGSVTFAMDAGVTYSCFVYMEETGKTVDCVVRAMLVPGEEVAEWEAYTEQTLTIPVPNGLPGIPVSNGGNYTDKNGQQWICDEIDFARGVYVQRVLHKVFDGTENWRLAERDEATEKQGAFYLALNIPASSQAFTTRYSCITTGATRIVGVFDTQYSQIRINAGDYTTTESEWKEQLAEWLAAGKPLEFYGIKTAPDERNLTEEELAAYVALRTNKPNTTIYNDAGAWMAVEYVADPKIYIDNKFNELAAAIVNNT